MNLSVVVGSCMNMRDYNGGNGSEARKCLASYYFLALIQ